MFNTIKRLSLSILIIILLTISVDGQPLSEDSPEKVGLSSERLNRINNLMQNFVDQHKLSGVVTMIARHGKIAHFRNIGMIDIETKMPIQRNTIFRIASMSKPIISVAIMILYENGHFQLDDPVSKYIPEFKGLRVYNDRNKQGNEMANREITIQDLLRHTSGLTYDFGNTVIDSMYRAVKVLDEKGTLKDMIQKLAQIPLLYQPGEKWNYSVSTDVAGYLIEVVSGKPLDKYLSECIFKPLGMEDTGFYITEGKLPRLSTVYKFSNDKKLVPIPDSNKSNFSQKPSFISGGGGLLSTAFDYMLFSQMLLNKGELNGKRILSPKTVELMTMNHVPSQAMPIHIGLTELEFLVNGHGFGLGFRVLTNLAEFSSLGNFGAYGWFGAYGTYFCIDPKEELIGILMTQFEGPPYYPSVKEFQILMYQSIIN